MTRFVTVLLTLVALGAIATLTTPAYAQFACSDADLSAFSPYAVYWQGYTNSAGDQVPWAGTGELWFTADGKARISFHASVSGVSKPDTATGTYTVAPDCTGTLTVAPVNGTAFTAGFSAPFGGEDIIGLDSTAGDTMSFSAYSVNFFEFIQCSDASLSAFSPEVIYWQGYTNSGGKQVPWAGNGVLSFGADGSLTATLNESINGVPQTDTTAGTYKVATNCTGSLTLASVNGGTFTATFVTPFGGEDIQGVDTTTGDTMAFSGFPLEEDFLVNVAANAKAKAKARAKAHLLRH